VVLWAQKLAHSAIQQAFLLEQVTALLSGLALAVDRVGQGHFDDLAGVARALGRPVSEGRAEAVRSQARATHPRQQF
jgi:hypothetical protein